MKSALFEVEATVDVKNGLERTIKGVLILGEEKEIYDWFHKISKHGICYEKNDTKYLFLPVKVFKVKTKLLIDDNDSTMKRKYNIFFRWFY